MPRLRLTQQNCSDIELPDHGYVLYKDTKVKGLSMRVLYSGSKTWVVEYKGNDGKRKRYVIGTYPVMSAKKAEIKAISVLGEIADGEDPQAERQKLTAWTLHGWSQAYRNQTRAHKKSWKDDKLYLGIAEEIFGGSTPLSLIGRQDIQQAHFEMSNPDEDGMPTQPARANRWLSSISACLNAAVNDGILKYNPARGVKKFEEPPGRDRTLSDEEWNSVLKALETEELNNQIAFRMLMGTGARASEVLNAVWMDVRFEDKIWRLPRTKSGKSQVIPLRDDLTALLRMVRAVRVPTPMDHDFIIEGEDGNLRSSLRSTWTRIKKNAGIHGVRIHDIRRTVGLRVTRESGLHVASKLLRHSDIRITEKIYAPLSIDELRGAVNGIGDVGADQD